MQDLAGSSGISSELRVRGGSFSLGSGHLPPHPTLFTVLASYACCLPLYYSIYMYDQASYCDIYKGTIYMQLCFKILLLHFYSSSFSWYITRFPVVVPISLH